MATYNITITTTANRDAEMQLLCTEKGVTVQQLFQASADGILDNRRRERQEAAWQALTLDQRKTALAAV